METVEIIRVVSLVLRIAVVVLCAAAWLKRPKERLWVIAPLSYAVNGIIFYWLTLSKIVTDPVTTSIWSSSLGLHVGFLTLGAVWLFLWPARKGRGK